MSELRDEYLDYLNTRGLLDEGRFADSKRSARRGPTTVEADPRAVGWVPERLPGERLRISGQGDVDEPLLGPGDVWGGAASRPVRAAAHELVPYLMKSVSRMAPLLTEAMQAARRGGKAAPPVSFEPRAEQLFGQIDDTLENVRRSQPTPRSGDIAPRGIPSGRFSPTDPEEDAMSELLGRLVRGEATPDETQEIRDIVQEYHRMYRQGGTSGPVARQEGEALEATGEALDPWERGAQKSWESEADDAWGSSKAEAPEPPKPSTPTPRSGEPTSEAIGRTQGDYDTGLLKMLLDLSKPQNADYRDMAEGQIRRNLGRTVDRPLDDPWRP